MTDSMPPQDRPAMDSQAGSEAPVATGRTGWFTGLPMWGKILFILIWPVSVSYGVYWMWKDEKFSKNQRIALTAAAAVLFIWAFATSGGNTSPTREVASEPAATSAAPVSEPAPKPAPAPKVEPEPEPTVDEEPEVDADILAYALDVTPINSSLTEHLGELGVLLQEPRFGQEDWVLGVAVRLAGLRVAADEAREVEAPASMQDVHSKWMDAVEGYEWVSFNLATAIDDMDVSLMETCVTRMNEANEDLQEAVTLLDAKASD